MTPREISDHGIYHRARIRETQSLNTVQAHTTAMLQRAKKIPKVEQLIGGGSQKTKVLTPEQAARHRAHFEQMKRSMDQLARRR